MASCTVCKNIETHMERKVLLKLLIKRSLSIKKFDFELFARSLNKILNVTVPEIRQATYNIIQVLEKECLTVLKSSISEIICYGLGEFTDTKSAQYELGFLVCLREHFNHIPVYVYDPLFCDEEIRILRHLGLQVIETNEEDKRMVQNKTTLVFMPHCSYKFTNNFLYANWGNGLNNCILLANSFEEVQESFKIPPLCKYQVEVHYLLDIAPYVTEIKLEDSFKYYFERAFNTLSIHIFSKENLLKVPTDVWENREAPQYSQIHNDFIIACICKENLSTSSEFTVLTRNLGRQKSGKNIQELVKSTEKNFLEKFDRNLFTRLLDRILHVTVPKVREATYTKDVIKVLEKECLTVLKSNTISEIICYGLGQFSDKKSAEYQLGFLLCLREHFNHISVYVYDPMFCHEEIRMLWYFGLYVIERNEEGKRVMQNKTTLVYMPHCSYELTNNFLFANWGIRLNNCILLANSFEKVKNHMIPPCEYLGGVRYLLDIAPYVTEIKLENF